MHAASFYVSWIRPLLDLQLKTILKEVQYWSKNDVGNSAILKDTSEKIIRRMMHMNVMGVCTEFGASCTKTDSTVADIKNQVNRAS